MVQKQGRRTLSVLFDYAAVKQLLAHSESSNPPRPLPANLIPGLADRLKRLRLPAMVRDYPECSRQAKEGGESYEGFLLDLATRELEQRQANQLKRRLKEVRFPVMKTWVGHFLSITPGHFYLVKTTIFSIT